MLPQSYQDSNLLEGADRVGGQLRGDKECPFSGVTKSGRVWRKVPESGARSVPSSMQGMSTQSITIRERAVIRKLIHEVKQCTGVSPSWLAFARPPHTARVSYHNRSNW